MTGVELPKIEDIMKAAAAVAVEPQPLVRAAVPETLTYRDNHPDKPGAVAVFEAPYMFSYDVRDMRVSDGLDKVATTDLTVFKGILVNTLENFVAQYAEQVWQLVQVSAQIEKKQRGGRQVINNQFGMRLISIAENALVEAETRLMAWDGKSVFSALLPYAEIGIVPESEDMKAPFMQPAGQIDTLNSKPRAIGMLFSARFSNG